MNKERPFKQCKLNLDTKNKKKTTTLTNQEAAGRKYHVTIVSRTKIAQE